MSDEVPRIDLVVDGDHPATIDLEVVTGGLTELAAQELIDDALEGFDPADGSNWTLTRDTGLELHHVKTTLIPDAETTIGTGWGWPYYPDGGGGFLVGSDGVLRHYAASEGSAFKVGVTTVDGTDLYAAPRQEVTIAGAPAIDYCSGGPIVDLGGGVGMMIVHEERGEFGDASFWWTLGAAKVVDVAGTITIDYLGPIITHEIAEAETIAGSFEAGMNTGGYLIHDGYVYVYHPDTDDAGVTHNAVSRCLLTDIDTDVTANTAPTFNKWAGETLAAAWTTLSLGGDAYAGGDAYLAGPLVNTGDFLTLPDGRHLWVGCQNDGGNYSVWFNVASDPLTWNWASEQNADVILPAQTLVEYYAGTLWSGDHDSPQTITRPSALFSFVESADLIGRWGDYTVDQLELWSVTSVDPNIQPERIYVVTVDVDLATLDGPGRVVAGVAPLTITMPELGTRTEYWEILNGTDRVAGEVVTVAVASGDLTFNGGTLTEVELRPEEVAHITAYTEPPNPPTWIAYTTSTGTRAAVKVFQAAASVSVPVSGLGGTTDGETLTLSFLAGVFPAGSNVLLLNQTDAAHDGIYVADDDGFGFTTGDFLYAPDFEQPFRTHGVGLPIFSQIELTTGRPVQGTIATPDGVEFGILGFAYTPANDLHYPDVSIESIAQALDELAARLFALENE